VPELAEAIGQMHALECAVHRQMLGLIAAFDRDEGWREDGATSVVPWLVAALGVSHSTAASWARTAHRLEALPAVAAAYGEGRLSADQLAPVLRMATPENEAELVEAAVGWSAAEARAIARKAAPKAEPPARGTLRWWRDSDDDDVLHLRGALRGDAAAVVEQRLEEETAKAPGNECHQVRAAEALTNLCAARDKTEAGRAVVVVHADADDLAENETLQRLTCDGSVRVVEHGPDGAVVGVGRAHPGQLDDLVPRRRSRHDADVGARNRERFGQQVEQRVERFREQVDDLNGLRFLHCHRARMILFRLCQRRAV